MSYPPPPSTLSFMSRPFFASSSSSTRPRNPSHASSSSSSQLPPPPPPPSLEQLISDINDPERRENALSSLSKRKDLLNDLAPVLWHSAGTVTALLQEVIKVYPYLSPPTLTAAQSHRACNALALLKCVASHPETRMLFLSAQLPQYLYAFLNTTSQLKPMEYLRLTTLGVLGALVKVDDTEVIKFLLGTEIVPLCLRTMENGTELSRTVATFIIERVLMDNVGLDYVCVSAERFFALSKVLEKMVNSLGETPSPRLLKHIIRCYLSLTDNPRACDALGTCLPDLLKNSAFTSCLDDDVAATQWLYELMYNIDMGGKPPAGFNPLDLPM